MASETFAGVLEAADQLSLGEQEDLVEILHRRVIEGRRDELAKDIREALEEHATRGGEAASVEELMREIRE